MDGGQDMHDDVLEGTAGGHHVVRCNRRVRGIGKGDLVVVLPIEAVLADAQLLGLPTVRRVAREGLRSVVLVPLAEWRERFADSSSHGAT